MIQVTPTIKLDERELSFHFIHSSGPGGQNVNKVATAVQLRFDAVHSASLPEAVRQRLLQQQRNRINRDGELVIDARRFRSQERNRDDALNRLVAFIQQAAQVPKPRRKTRPSKAAKERRLKQKQQKGEKKRLRKPPPV